MFSHWDKLNPFPFPVLRNRQKWTYWRQTLKNSTIHVSGIFLYNFRIGWQKQLFQQFTWYQEQNIVLYTKSFFLILYVQSLISFEWHYCNNWTSRIESTLRASKIHLTSVTSICSLPKASRNKLQNCLTWVEESNIRVKMFLVPEEHPRALALAWSSYQGLLRCFFFNTINKLNVKAC